MVFVFVLFGIRKWWFLILFLYLQLKFNRCFIPWLKSRVFKMKVNNNRYLIKSHDKFVPFVGIQKTQPKPTVTLTFDDQRTLTCSLDHLVECKNGFKCAAAFVPGTCLSDGGRCVKNVFNGVKTHLYDIVQSYDHCYNTNGLISHNCSFVGSSKDRKSVV